jgi:carboxyl-terminal processing protease
MSAEEFAALVDEMIAELPDGAARWETRAERIEEDSTDLSNYGGIGAFVAFRAEPLPRIIILSTMPGSPAERTGLRAHDSVISVDDAPMSVEEGIGAIDRIRGPAGSDVTLTVRSPDGEEREVVVTRAQIATSDAVGYHLTPDREIGYMLIPPFVYEGMEQHVLGVLQLLSGEGEESPLKGLVLDLRIARGLNWPLEAMATIFNNGELGEVYTRDDVVPITIEGQDILSSQSLPIVILVGRDTSGGAEIFAALMQASGRAQVLGQTTPGDVEGGSVFDLSDGSRVIVSTSSYRAPDGRDIGLTGVIPDRVIDRDWDQVSAEEDPVRDEAERILRQ